MGQPAGLKKLPAGLKKLNNMRGIVNGETVCQCKQFSLKCFSAILFVWINLEVYKINRHIKKNKSVRSSWNIL